MAFNSIDFLCFFPIVIFIYFIVPPRTRYIWLLVASYYFYMGWNPKYVLLIACSTIISFTSSIFISYFANKGNKIGKNIFLISSLASNFGILGLFKYANFFLANISIVLNHLGINFVTQRLDLLLPVGISFYTFQAIGYTLDVYYGKIQPEKNLLKYALFVSFFPQLVAGPIERAQNLLPQIQHVAFIKVWEYKRIRNGFMLMMWGLFQKLVIADRAAILVNNVVNHYTNFGFVELATAIILFAIQIYCDFSGYTNIAIGAARVMGFSFINNFKQPYLALSIKDFWRRWHVSLTSWFTDYLYIPLGGNRKGIIRKYFNIFIVFGVSGLWHGASWSYIVWGLLHAFYQIVGDMKENYFLKNKKAEICFSARVRKVTGTFLLVDFAWIFFIANGFTNAIGLIRRMISCFQTTGIYDLGLDRANWFLLMFSITILLIVDILHEKGISIHKIIDSQEIWFRGLLYMGLIWTTIMFGIYGIAYDTSTFIYFQF